MVGAAKLGMIVIVLLASGISCGDELANKTISRKKRYVVFPDGASLLARYSVATNLIGVKDPSNWFHIIELDAIYKLPNSTRILPTKAKVKKRKKVPHFHEKEVYWDKYYYKHRRDRRDVYNEITEMLQMQGLDGRSCVLRAMCEVRFFLSKSKDLSIFEEIFLTVFTFPPGNDDVDNEAIDYKSATNQETACKEWNFRCPVSLLDFVFSNVNSI